MNPARRLFPICVSPLSFTQLHFGIVNPYGTSCVSTSRSPRRFSHRQFGFCNPHKESACLLSEALGRSHIGILDLTTLTHLVRVDFRHSRTIRSSPCRAPLLTFSPALPLINFSSNACVDLRKICVYVYVAHVLSTAFLFAFCVASAASMHVSLGETTFFYDLSKILSLGQRGLPLHAGM